MTIPLEIVKKNRTCPYGGGRDDCPCGGSCSFLAFSDGVVIPTGGPYRIHEEADGLYVTGNGFLCPVDSRAEAEELLRVLTEAKEALR